MDDRRKKILDMDEMDWRSFVDDQMRNFERNNKENFALLQKNTELTQETKNSVSEMVSVFNTTQTGLKTFSSVGNFIGSIIRKWGPVVAYAYAAWSFFHGNSHKGD